MATRTNGHRERRHAAALSAVINVRKREISPRYLSEDEGVRIADLHRAGNGFRAIAEELSRSPATISRELRRNLDPWQPGSYRPFTAQRLAVERRARPGRGKLYRRSEGRTENHRP